MFLRVQREVRCPQTKRQRADSLKLARKTKQLQARKAKRSRTTHEESSRVCVDEANELDELLTGTDALDTDNEETDPSFVLESSMMSDSEYITETFCEDWVSHIDRDNCVSLGLFLCFQLAKHLGLAETKAAESHREGVGSSKEIQ